MEERARQAGCDLILDPYVTVAPTGGDVRLRHDPGATALRLRTLQESIESMPDEKVRAVIKRGLAIVGDLFLAEAVVPCYSGDYQQRTFTWHAPTVLSWLQGCDVEFRDLLVEQAQPGRSSPQTALDEMAAILADLPSGEWCDAGSH